MKKNFLILTLILILSVSLLSCGKKEVTVEKKDGEITEKTEIDADGNLKSYDPDDITAAVFYDDEGNLTDADGKVLKKDAKKESTTYASQDEFLNAVKEHFKDMNSKVSTVTTQVSGTTLVVKIKFVDSEAVSTEKEKNRTDSIVQEYNDVFVNNNIKSINVELDQGKSRLDTNTYNANKNIFEWYGHW